MITGRDGGQLHAVAREIPGVETLVNDLGNPAGRQQLAAFISQAMPGMDLLINNAGIQRRVALAQDDAPWAERQQEIDILLSGPIHLNHLLIPLMLAHGRPSLI